MSGNFANYWAHLWRIARLDGAVIAVTDHDFDLVVNGETFHAHGAMRSSEVEGAIGLESENAEYLGGIDGEIIKPEELKAGLFQGARVQHFLYDFEKGAIIRKIFEGEIARLIFGENNFRAELRSDLERVDYVYGRRFNKECDVEFCSRACGLDAKAFGVESKLVKAAGEKLTIEARAFLYPIDNGSVAFLDRDNGTTRMAIREAQKRDEFWELELWQKPLFEAHKGERVRVFAGCDKSFAQCKILYRNALNFRGFPHMPGEQILTQRADRNE